MPKLIREPTLDEYVGRVNSKTEDLSEYVAVCLPAFSPDTVHRDG